MDKDIPALILGDGITALGVAKSLSRAVVPYYFLDNNLHSEKYSRYCARPPQDWGLLNCPEELGQYLSKLPIEKAVLIACGDHYTTAVAQLPEQLKERFPASVPDIKVQELFTDKNAFQKLVKQYDVPVPLTEEIDSEAQLQIIDAEPERNFFFKPYDSQSFFEKYGVKGVKVVSTSDAVARFKIFKEDGYKVVLQEFIIGTPDNQFYLEGYLSSDGEVKALLARQRTRGFPLDFGYSTAMRSVKRGLFKETEEPLIRMLKGVGYKGIFSAEFKKDPVTGVLKIIEVNARPWWYIWFSTLCGVNLSEMAYFEALGKKVSIVPDYRTGIKCINYYFDFQVWKARKKEKPLRATLEFLGDCISSYSAGATYYDPMPGVALFFELLLAKLK